MAGEVTITVEDRQARLKISRLSVEVRDNLRRVLPPLINALAASAENKLNTDLKSRRTLTVDRKIHDVGGATNRIYGEVSLQSPSANGLLPTYLEFGTNPHIIEGNPYLAFYWEKLGRDVVFAHVNHPGTKPYQIMSRAFQEMRDEIVSQMTEAAKTGARSV